MNTTLKTAFSLMAALAAASPITSRAAVVCHSPPSNPLTQQTLIVGAAAVEDHLRHGDSAGACGCPIYSCDFTRLFVSESAQGRENGTKDHPFGSMTAALKYADRNDLHCVDLALSAGRYAEDVIRQRRNIKLTGLESGVVIATDIANDGPYSLSLANLRVAEAPGGEVTAISVENACAETNLDNVIFDAVKGLSFSQKGGFLLAENTTIRETGSSDFAGSGSGLSLTDGVSACIYDSSIVDNQGFGLVVRGESTRALLDESEVKRNGAKPVTPTDAGMWVSGGAGIWASEGAHVIGQNLSLAHNSTKGIALTESARGAFRDLSIHGTRGGEEDLIAGIAVDRSSLLDLSYAAICDSEVVGAILDLGESSVVASIESTLLARNLIGLSIQIDDATDFDLLEHQFSCLENLIYQDNVVDLDADIVSPPGGLSEQQCDNGIDDDLDLLIDCADPDCSTDPVCSCSEDDPLCTAPEPEPECPTVSVDADWCESETSIPVAISCPDPQ